MRDHVLIVDDDPFIRRFLRRALVQAGYSVSVAAAGREGIGRAEEERPAVILLDVMLPDLDGVTVCQRLRRVSNAIIIMLSARTDNRTRVDSLDGGADDYLAKPFELSELLAHLRAQLRRYRADGAVRLRFADLDVDPLQRTALRGNRPLALTSKEFDILLVFLRNPGRVIDRPTIFEEVWSESAEEISNTVEVHVHRLRAKLHGLGEPPLLHTVRGAGYVLREPEAGATRS